MINQKENILLYTTKKYYIDITFLFCIIYSIIIIINIKME